MRSVQCLAIAIALASPAFAQTATDRVKLDVSRAELQTIGQALMEMPYKTAAPVMNTLQQQLGASDQAAAKAAADAKAAAEKKPEEKPAEAAPAEQK